MARHARRSSQQIRRATSRVTLEARMPDVTSTPTRERYTLSLLSAPITRVEWDRLKSAGLDPIEWFERFPQDQRHLPQIEVSTKHGRTAARWSVGSNVTVLL